MVSLEVNGVRYGGWTKLRIDRSLETLSGGFELTVTERWPGQNVVRGVNPGDECRVRIGSDVVVTGFVDDVPIYLDDSDHMVRVVGRDYTGDLVDCSAIHSPGQWTGQKLERIVQALIAPYRGIKLVTRTSTGEAFKKFAIEQGETVYEAITRLCKLRAVLPYSDGKGNLVLATAGTNRAKVSLVEGENVTKLDATFSQRERYSEIHVKSQSKGSDHTHPSVTTGWRGNAIDPEIRRHRPLLIIAENQANGRQCQERAEWEKTTRYGKGTRVTVTVQGWRQGGKDTDPLWDLNTLVYTVLPSAKIRETLLVAGVTYLLEENAGTVTELTLVKPEAYRLIRAIERTD